MITVELRGKKFPLCLTVAALDQINEKCGGLKKLSEFLAVQTTERQGEETHIRTEFRIVNVAWLLGLLIQEGEENRFVCARFDDPHAARRAVPDSDAIAHLLTPGTAKRYVGAVYEAINESLRQDIEAAHEKNAVSAGEA